MTCPRFRTRHRFVVACALAVTTAWPIAADLAAGDDRAGWQEPLFSARVDRVRVDVSVRQDGRAVRGLRAEDFEVLDNGVAQRVDFIGFERVPVRVVLALDTSGSVQGERLTLLRRAGARLVELLEPADEAAVLTFTNLVTVRTPLTSDSGRLLTALDQPASGLDTSLIDAVHAAMVLGESDSGRPLVIVFSDGADTASFLTAEQVLDTASRTGPVVYAVTTPEAGPADFIENLVRMTAGRRLRIASLDELSDAFTEILAEARERYLLSYTPAGVDDPGWHELTVRVRNRRVDVRARPGYLARQP